MDIQKEANVESNVTGIIQSMDGMAIGKMARSLAPNTILGIILGIGIVPKLDI